MSQNSRIEDGGRRDISRTATEGTEQQKYEGFEGMNFEQVRQPFNPKHTGRTRTNDQRNDFKRPDEA
jgi:hypothetical protein